MRACMRACVCVYVCVAYHKSNGDLVVDLAMIMMVTMIMVIMVVMVTMMMMMTMTLDVPNNILAADLKCRVNRSSERGKS